MRRIFPLAALLLSGCFPGRESADTPAGQAGNPADTAEDSAAEACPGADDDCVTAAEGDCDDADPDTYPGAPEACDGLDNDCDGAVDDDAGATYYADVDGDSYGDPTTTERGCTRPAGTVDNGADCDDGDADRHPGATERANDLDDDCDGDVDEGAPTTATVTSVKVTWAADGATVKVQGSAAGWTFGIAETGAGSAGWFGESCVLGDQPRGYPDYGWDVCHTLGASGGSLVHVATPDEVVDGRTLFSSSIASANLTYVLTADDGSACWTWGDDPGYYSALGCADLP